VLCAAYGHVNDHRSVPRIGYDYSLMMFPVNQTGSYRYIPQNNSVAVHDLTVNKETLRPHDQNWPSDASFVLVVVWNQTRMSNPYFASAEAGCLVQNVYLAAASLNLGTCCVGAINSQGLRNDLKLASTSIPLLVMPLGYPADPYPNASPNYDLMIGNLPPVQYSQLSFEDALKNMQFAKRWSAENLSSQEASQLLWAAYGYTNVTYKTSYHRTTPSAMGIYPLLIFVSHATGVYQYLPENHSVAKILHGDKRLDVANACAGQSWAASAPLIFLIVYNSSYNDGNTGDGGTLPHEFMEVNAGAVIQQLVLEASACNLSANVISKGLEEWNGTGASELRTILDLSPQTIPLFVVPIGKRTPTLTGDLFPDGKIDMRDIAIVAKAFNTSPGDPLWVSEADLNADGKIDMKDIAIVAKAFGTVAKKAFTIDAPSQDPDFTTVEPYQNVTVTVHVVDVGVGIREVILSYSVNEGQTWINTTMNNLLDNTYMGKIPGFEAGTHVQYKIIAYDNADNPAIEDKDGEYYVYTVIPEFPTTITLLLLILTLIVSMITKKHQLQKKRKQN